MDFQSEEEKVAKEGIVLIIILNNAPNDVLVIQKGKLVLESAKLKNKWKNLRWRLYKSLFYYANSMSVLRILYSKEETNRERCDG